MRCFTGIIFLCFFHFYGAAQERDTINVDQVAIQAPFLRSSLLKATATVSIISNTDLQQHPPSSMVSALNTAPGVRMEERSPGSYRLSIRGSLLRSPFGIRNIKIYADEFSLTDAGGNTYLNLIDVGAANSIEIIKGPVSSIFGANTGGAVLLNLRQDHGKTISLNTGSFGLIQQNARAGIQNKALSLYLTESILHANGYREQSAMNRKYFQANPVWRYNNRGILNTLLFYSDLHYETPGGLTLAQSIQDPSAARPATPTLPGAVAQNAGIFNKSLFAGVSNTYTFNQQWKHVIALQYLHTDFKNPFITNYEVRQENTIGLRTYLSYHEKNFNADAGIETSGTSTRIDNSTNNAGTRGTLMAKDDLAARQLFAFSRLRIQLLPALLLETALSVNFYTFSYQTIFPDLQNKRTKSLSVHWMPSVAASWVLSPALAWRASVSRGYSPPTIAEIRASDNQINANLNAEHGYNFETGIRIQNNTLQLDAAVFSFRLKDAIVRRVTAADTEFYINAGGTVQNGIELQGSYFLFKNKEKLFSSVKIGGSYTYHNFKFSDYTVNSQNFSGNRLTGVPQHVCRISTAIGIKKSFSLYLQYQTTSAIWLNDANNVAAKNYSLAEAKLSWKAIRKDTYTVELTAGANNLLNEAYSLGNDLNAAGSRYYNPAAGRNYYGGIGVTF